MATMTSEVMSTAEPCRYAVLVPAAVAVPSPFGTALKRFRTTRGLSQERLAQDAEISTRHLSCLETGRAAPSKTMVLVLGSALDLPLRERNTLLETAGFVAAYRDAPLDAPEQSALKHAVELVLGAMEPNGAIAVDRAWNLLHMNDGARKLLATFLPPDAPPEVLGNVVVATLHPKGFRDAIVNFDEVATHTLDRARREAARAPEDPLYAKVQTILQSIPDLPTVRDLPNAAGPFIPVHLKRGPHEARLFTTLSVIGTPMDATAEEIRIETYFPADEATRGFLASLARG